MTAVPGYRQLLHRWAIADISTVLACHISWVVVKVYTVHMEKEYPTYQPSHMHAQANISEEWTSYSNKLLPIHPPRIVQPVHYRFNENQKPGCQHPNSHSNHSCYWCQYDTKHPTNAIKLSFVHNDMGSPVLLFWLSQKQWADCYIPSQVHMTLMSTRCAVNDKLSSTMVCAYQDKASKTDPFQFIKVFPSIRVRQTTCNSCLGTGILP